MNKIAVTLTVVLLAGCGATVKTSSARGVYVHAPTVASAQELANGECAKHKRFAKYSQPGGNFTHHFDCVE